MITLFLLFALFLSLIKDDYNPFAKSDAATMLMIVALDLASILLGFALGRYL